MKLKITRFFIAVSLIGMFSFGLFSTQAGTQTVTTITKDAQGVQDGYHYQMYNAVSASMTLNKGGTFSCQWSSASNSFFNRGLLFATHDKTYSQLGDITCTYSADYQVKSGSSGLVFMVYSHNAYYWIIENSSNWSPYSNATKKGTVTLDGGTYDIYEETDHNGTETIKQYYSVRTSNRTSGTISVTKHFAKWESLGMQTGAFYECALEVDAFTGSGSCNVSTNTITIAQSSTPTPTTQPDSSIDEPDSSADESDISVDEQDSSTNELEEEQIVLEAKGELKQVTLNWNSIPEVQGYYVYKSATPGGQTNTPETDFWIEDTTYIDTKVITGTKYYYFVRPVNQDNSMGPASNEVSAGAGKVLGMSPGKVLEPAGRSGIIELTVGEFRMDANGKTIEVDPGSRTAPVIAKGRLCLPVNGILKEMGGTSTWNSKEQKVSMVLNGNTVEMWIGKTTFTVNNVKKTMDVAPWLSKTGRPMLPLRFVTENLGCKLSLEGGNTQKATIEYWFAKG